MPRCESSAGQEVAAHGVVPCAMSPRTVAAPVAQRRPIARISIGDRSCASSTTMCAIDGVRSIRSAASSISTWSARVHGAEPGPRGGFGQLIAVISASVSRPVPFLLSCS